MKVTGRVKLSLIVLLMLSGCGSPATQITNGEYQEGKRESIAAEPTAKQESPERNGITEISYQSDTIDYKGEFSAIRDVAIGNQYLYINGIHDNISGFEVMKNGESSGIHSKYEIPEGMVTLCMSVDSIGNGHVLLMSYEENQLDFKKSEIWCMNPDGERIRTTDITQTICVQNRIRPNMMAVSEKGYYYIVDEFQSGHIMILDQDGGLAQDVSDERQRFIHGIGRGGDGNIYAVCQDTSLTVIRFTEEDSIEDMEITLPEAFSRYMTIGSVPEYLCGVMSMERGAFGIGGDASSIHEIYKEADFPYESEKFAGSGFLDDGRMVLAERISEDKLVFHYLPFSGERQK